MFKTPSDESFVGVLTVVMVAYVLAFGVVEVLRSWYAAAKLFQFLVWGKV